MSTASDFHHQKHQSKTVNPKLLIYLTHTTQF